MRLAVLLVLLLAAPAWAAPPLRDVVLVVDPGHGDRGHGAVPDDPGAGAASLHGQAWECVFTWDTAMRLRRGALERGAEVFLTLEDPEGDHRPHDWRPDRFPDLGAFRFKTLVERPRPATVEEALVSRVETANRVYSRYAGRKDVYFLSLHFDSTAPYLAGISFYHAPGRGTPFVQALCEEIRAAGRERRNLVSSREHALVAAHPYTVLARSANPDSYLVELGNLRSADGSDLWRMRALETREQYAGLILRALESYTADRAGWQHRISHPRPPSRRIWVVAAGLLLALAAWSAWKCRQPRKPMLE